MRLVSGTAVKVHVVLWASIIVETNDDRTQQQQFTAMRPMRERARMDAKYA